MPRAHGRAAVNHAPILCIERQGNSGYLREDRLRQYHNIITISSLCLPPLSDDDVNPDVM